MNKNEPLVLTAIFLCLAAPLIFVNSFKWIEGGSDTAFLTVVTENVASTGRANNPLFHNILDYLEKIATLPSDQAADVDLARPDDQYNHFRFHAYFILYIIAPLTWVVPANVLWPALIVLAHLALLLSCYVFLRRKSVPLAASALFCVLVTFHPHWTMGLHGQIFVDRLFLGLGALFLFAFTAPKPHRPSILLTAALCALLTERTAMVVGVFALGHTVFYWRQRAEARWFSVALGLGMLTYGVLITGLFLDNFYYSGFMPGSWDELIGRFAIPGYTEKTLEFLAVNLAILGILAALEPRAFLLAFGMMVPNVFGYIGGAEKTGWVTHYHSAYLPFLAWAAAQGYARIPDLMKRPRWKALAFTGAFALAVAANQATIAQNGLVTILGELPEFLRQEYREARFKTFIELRQQIPQGSAVSGPERVFPALYKGRQLSMFPLGVEQAEYAIPSIVSYLGEENRVALETAIRLRMRTVGYDMDNPITCGHLQVFRRTTTRSTATAM